MLSNCLTEQNPLQNKTNKINKITNEEIHEQITDYKFMILYFKSLIETESSIEEFRLRSNDIVNHMFEKYKQFSTGPIIDVNNSIVFYDQIVELARQLIVVDYNDIFYDDRRVFILNIILANILKNSDSYYVINKFHILERDMTNLYTRMYKYILRYHNLKSYALKYEVMKDLACRIIEHQSKELKATNVSPLKNISYTMDRLRINLRTDCDKLFNNDYTISKSQIKNPNDNIFDAMDLITQLAIIGCAETIEVLLEETHKIRDLKYVHDLATVAQRYNNKYCYHVLTKLIQKSRSTMFGYDFIPDIESQKPNNLQNQNQQQKINLDLEKGMNIEPSIFMESYNTQSGVSDLTGPYMFSSNNDIDVPYIRIRDDDSDINTDANNNQNNNNNYDNHFDNHFDVNLPCVSCRVYYKTHNLENNPDCTLF